MTFQNNLLKKNNIILLVILSLGIFYRFYQSNFDDLWLDEFFGFWMSDPKLDFYETYQRSLGPGWGQNMFFDFVLKYFFYFFGYSPELGRFFISFIGSLNIILITYLSYQIDKSRSFILVAFLASHCWHLISYSQELRGYSFGFFLALLSLILFIKILNFSKPKNKIFFGFFYIVVNLCGLINHIFFGLLVFAQSLFLLNFLEEKEKFKFLLISFLITFLAYLFLMYPFLIKNLTNEVFWLQQLSPKFYIEYFFPRFFGSKIMGYLYLIIFVFLIIYSRNEIFKKKSYFQLLFLIFFVSYLIPIIYGYIKIPILTDRYIIFVLIPIIILLSSLLFRLKKFKKTLIAILCVFTFFNNYLEIFKRENTKPVFKEPLKYINQNSVQDVVVLSQNIDSYIWLKNYLEKIDHEKFQSLNFVNKEKTTDKIDFWVICYHPLNSFNCNFFDSKPEYKRMQNYEYYLVDLILYKK